MERQARNKRFVATGGGIVIVVALLVVVIWYIVTRANHHAALNSGNGRDSTTDTGSTKGVKADSLPQ